MPTFDLDAYQRGPRVFPYCPPLTSITQNVVEFRDITDKTIANEQPAPAEWPAWPAK